MGQNPSTMMREIDKLYRKPLLKVNAATDASTSYQNVGVYLVFTDCEIIFSSHDCVLIECSSHYHTCTKAESDSGKSFPPTTLFTATMDQLTVDSSAK